MTKYKFKMGEKVFCLGRAGICVVSGRGWMSFISGGTLNMYQISGAHSAFLSEHEIMSVEEMKALRKEEEKP